MNDILWDLAESEQGFNVSITAEYMSQFDCCSEPSMNVQDLVTLLNYTFEAVRNDSLKRDESYFKNPSVFFNNDRFYDFVPLMPAMMELYYYESEQIGWFTRVPQDYVKFIDDYDENNDNEDHKSDDWRSYDDDYYRYYDYEIYEME
eukprot:CAMPEP_0116874082 /NCGR_PEP_ID=MMETSP0463-20121206/5479_1 /TAXON_ID=181622 /ORGANISM="Strombidinopsis sp, Strain SopsisLIS2011" /LENGTH=146 /DNA_ID=CAMNT_0004517241 /DNA_START=3639 /DNA_END=4079 /DNA_ORIENTATION=-